MEAFKRELDQLIYKHQDWQLDDLEIIAALLRAAAEMLEGEESE